ncbi:MAG: hypothetical protein Q4B60_07520 [Erysipelotrichaceae bacterium]|nr:hypothetical protein [Erysipelotrichaceae bacterium]
MNFSEFVIKAQPFLGCGKNIKDYTMDLLLSIVEEEGKQIIYKLSPKTFDDYYRNKRSIKSLAKKIIKHLDTTEFQIELDNLSDESVIEMVKIFKDYIAELNTLNLSDELPVFYEAL